MQIEDPPKALTTARLLLKKQRWFVIFLLLAVVEIILFSLGRQYYGMVVIPFFFFLILSQPRNFPLLAASILVIALLNTPTVDSWVKFKNTTTHVTHQVPDVLAKIFTPGSGEEVLPEKVRYMLFLMRKYRIANYRLEKTFENDGIISQRIIEAAWPIKIEKTSPYVFSLSKEIINDPNCEIVDQKEDVALAYCR